MWYISQCNSCYLVGNETVTRITHSIHLMKCAMQNCTLNSKSLNSFYARTSRFRRGYLDQAKKEDVIITDKTYVIKNPVTKS